MPRKKSRKSPPPPAPRRDAPLRIVGGKFRGRRLDYAGDLGTRPMKDRTREAVFNLLGPAVAGKHAVDLFAGTGALGLEALSRGAARATLIERHYPTLRVIEQNVARLEVGQQTEVLAADAFRWSREHRLPDDPAWVVFCSPPYDFYVERADDMLRLIAGLAAAAPAGSLLVVEADGRFDTNTLPDSGDWDIRRYPPAVVAIYENVEDS